MSPVGGSLLFGVIRQLDHPPIAEMWLHNGSYSHVPDTDGDVLTPTQNNDPGRGAGSHKRLRGVGAEIIQLEHIVF